ncbi:ferritin-like domain-containing protein [Gorillibacterium massiliense]|uniref:ferritin-like domain-containing protein n=1 Tax=Gorillibacterium massiliense TaxID=1280390 RepID=UPI0004BC9783|nr:ferritin-like domain-containing protein [Gorillibacterium massiliense]
MYYPAYYRVDTGFAADIGKAVNGEYSAIACYEQLAKMAPNEEERKRISEIRSDEMRHLRVFSQIYASLTGRLPVPQITESCPTDYKAGLRFAFNDEQNTVDFYLDLADRAPEASMKESIRRIAADEQNHAVWFLSFMSLHNARS